MNEAVIAIDIGGTGLKCALVDVATGAIRHSERHPTGADRGPERVAEAIAEVASGLADRARADDLTPRAVGLVAPGVIDEAAGVAVWSANVGFRDVPLRDLVAKRLGLPAVLAHDVRAGALAEARLGAGRDAGRIWFVAIGTGIAAAYVRDGRTDSGAHGASGELGHVVVRPDGPPCACGQRGCVESLGSAAAVARRYADRSSHAVTAAEVVARAASGNVDASAVWDEAIDALADGLRIGITLYDPDAIIVGGGLAEAGPALLDPLGAEVRRRLTFQTMPLLVRAKLGDEAGCLGAAQLAIDMVAAA
ncbi:MAG TPA: ROK family protein [Micromonosporaceae bacterium]|jgi:glucokinase|nr:ROK family protein [Micromonosporaceae bacterium]